jgi:hypothetical protein
VLISRRGDRLALVTHSDHGRLAGALAEHWGGDGFAMPACRDALVGAATYHDDGWRELDDLPCWNEEKLRPAHFLELPLALTLGPYGRGVDAVYERDPLAGALVSMHWAGLYRRRWGVQAGEPVGHPSTDEVVTAQEARWTAALREAWDGDGMRSAFEAGVWHAYEVLQALDFISLFLCLADLTSPTEGHTNPIPVPVTMRPIDQPDAARLVPSVPVAAGGPYVDLTLTIPEPGVVVIDPYPFAEEGLTVGVPGRQLEDRPFDSAEAAAGAFWDAPVAQFGATLVARKNGA